jgi:pilus assembly protein CpaE
MKIPVVLIGEDSIALASLRQQLERDASFFVNRKPHNLDEATELLQKHPGPSVVIADLGRDPDRMFLALDDFTQQFPNASLIMTTADSSSEIILRALRVGATEFFAQPFNWPEVLQSLERLRNRIQVYTATHRQQGHLVTVFSSKGGVGTSTVATNVGVVLATAQQKTVSLVDLVLQFGSLTSFLNLDASYTILDFVKNLQRVDPLFIEGSLVRHAASGVRVLAEPANAEEAAKITSSDIEQIFDSLAQAFDYVLVDAPKAFDELSFVALDKSDLILFVMEMSIPALRSAHKALDSFERLRIDTKKVRLVLNRYERTKLLSQESVERTLALPTFFAIPNDYPTSITAINQGVPIQETNPSSKLAKSYRILAETLVRELSYVPTQRPEIDNKKKSLLSRFLPLRSAR